MELEQDLERMSGIPERPQRTAAVASIAIGALMGAMIGVFAMAGLPGFIVGGMAGAVLGAIVEHFSMKRDHGDLRDHDDRRDHGDAWRRRQASAFSR